METIPTNKRTDNIVLPLGKHSRAIAETGWDFSRSCERWKRRRYQATIMNVDVSTNRPRLNEAHITSPHGIDFPHPSRLEYYYEDVDCATVCAGGGKASGADTINH